MSLIITYLHHIFMVDSFWRKLLIEYFITEHSDSKQDDLLFFIYKLNRHDKLKSCSDPVVISPLFLTILFQTN